MKSAVRQRRVAEMRREVFARDRVRANRRFIVDDAVDLERNGRGRDVGRPQAQEERAPADQPRALVEPVDVQRVGD